MYNGRAAVLTRLDAVYKFSLAQTNRFCHMQSGEYQHHCEKRSAPH
jgi:hypothetical protein